MHEDEKPWWYWHCVHRGHEYWVEDGKTYGCFDVLKEAEGAVILHIQCLGQVHVMVNRRHVATICKTITYSQYEAMSELDAFRLIQEQFNKLKSL